MGDRIQRQVSRRLERKGRLAVEKHAQALEALVVAYVPIDSIRPNQYNPNRQSEREFELLLISMMEDGFTQPILVQRESHQIVDGEHRWRAASELGYKEVPVVFVDMSPEQMRISTLRHNRARGSEDVEAVTAILRDLEKLGALDKAMESLMLSEREVNHLLHNSIAPVALAGDSYGSAWEPSGQHDMPPDSGYEESRRMTRASVALKAAAAEVEEKLENETNEMARWDIMGADRAYGLSAMFSQEDGERIKAFLGEDPCSKILQIVQWELEENAGEVGETAQGDG